MASEPFTLEKTSLNAVRELPSNVYLVHATNCIAEWGAGIAAELAHVFPEAYKEYKKFCNSAKPNPSARWPPKSLAGQCLIIPPQAADVAAGAPRIHIVCLFTSYGYGRPNNRIQKPGKDNKPDILAQTRRSLGEFRSQLDGWAGQNAGGEITIYSPRFNSGAFKVPWEETGYLIEESLAGWGGRWLIMDPPSS